MPPGPGQGRTLGPDATVLGARFRLTPGARSALLDEIARDAELRRSKHPLEYASCGSYFKNPSPERPAARYIQDAGLKGFTVGRAQVSERHANFLVALEGARAADILALAGRGQAARPGGVRRAARRRGGAPWRPLSEPRRALRASLQTGR